MGGIPLLNLSYPVFTEEMKSGLWSVSVRVARHPVTMVERDRLPYGSLEWLQTLEGHLINGNEATNVLV